MTTHADFYAQVETDDQLVPRHHVYLEEYKGERQRRGEALDVLDVGCGEYAILHRHLHPEDRYHGSDVKPQLKVELPDYRQVDLNEDSLSAAFEGRTFDVIFCGEVLEHVFSPDRLLRELASVMTPDSLLVLSTPNLAYWVNRVLLPLGISPMFVENSAEVKLGRRFRWLGQGNETQGHIRMFTHRAALELIEREGFRVQSTRAVPVWGLPIDKVVCRYSNNLAPVNVYMLRRP